MPNSTQYAHVILPLAVNGYTYAVPSSMTVQVGSLVYVPLGKSRHYWGIVSSLSDKQPAGVTCKDIEQVAHSFPLVTAAQLQLFSWMASYYCCTMGEVLGAAIPTLLLHHTYKPAQVTYVKLVGDASLVKREQQRAILERYQQLASLGAVLKSELLEGQSISAFNTLVKNGIFACYEQETSRLALLGSQQQWPDLTPSQQIALQQINTLFAKQDVVLLHGVTASGKTEIYLQKIKETLQQGKQVLYLVPEIALTAQLEQRLQRVLGNKLVAYHSGLSDNERSEIYLDLLQKKQIQVVLGTRSAVFLPFQNIGLIIVDEEHEPSYKQYEPAPRYHAKNVALMMAQMAAAKTLLGSATPSIESYHLAQQGKYGYVSLIVRFNQAMLPNIKVIDRQDAFKKNRMKDMFSWFLLEKMTEALQAGEQVILFQNRRGFSSYVECPACNYVPKCKHCDVSLTYHKKSDKLVCHYCGYSMPVPQKCPTCGAEALKDRGFGTEKVIEALQKYFPEAKADRLDVDVSRSRAQYQGVLERFAKGDTQILVGTQMVAKGLDFDNVGLVGILNADNMMNFPDFRSGERAFQLMVQVSGRAGRRQKQGLVVLQTTQPDHY
ncbi:MAG: primosomal protein N', partial [Paludibacteraceae bacterium]|nr:primosomal protein N' [Paludibacteraceae bacterium]